MRGSGVQVTLAAPFFSHGTENRFATLRSCGGDCIAALAGHPAWIIKHACIPDGCHHIFLMKHPPPIPRYRSQNSEATKASGTWQKVLKAMPIVIPLAGLVFTVLVYVLQVDMRKAQRELAALEKTNLQEHLEAARSIRIAEAQNLLKRDWQHGRFETKLESRYDPRIKDAILFLIENNIKVRISADYVELYDLPIGCAEMEIEANSIVIGDSNLDRSRIRSSAKVFRILDSRLNDFELFAVGDLQAPVPEKVTITDSLILASDLIIPFGQIKVEDSSSRDSNIISKNGYIRFDRFRGGGRIDFDNLNGLPIGCTLLSADERIIGDHAILCRQQFSAATTDVSWPSVEIGDCIIFGDKRRSFTNLDRDLMRSFSRWNANMIEQSD